MLGLGLNLGLDAIFMGTSLTDGVTFMETGTLEVHELVNHSS